MQERTLETLYPWKDEIKQFINPLYRLFNIDEGPCPIGSETSIGTDEAEEEKETTETGNLLEEGKTHEHKDEKEDDELFSVISIYSDEYYNDDQPTISDYTRGSTAQFVDDLENADIIYFFKKKWKVFTIFSTIAVIIPYIVGLIEIGHYDRDAISYPNRDFFMGMVSLWPECHDNRYQLWRLVSNIFVHSGVDHIASNLFTHIGLSFLLELYQSAWVITPLFLVGVVHGNLAFYYTKPYMYAVGVSQGVFSIVGMNLANGLLNMHVYPFFHLVIIFYLVFALIATEAITYDESTNIAYISHWGSLVSGFLGGMACLKQYKRTVRGRYLSLFFLQLYACYTFVLFYHFGAVWPPMQSYTNILQPLDINNCCYEWFSYQEKNPNTPMEDFTCPYRVVYEDALLYRSSRER